MKRLKKVFIGLGIILVFLILGIGGLFFNEIKSIRSISEIMPRNEAHDDGNVYEMTMSGDYYFDELIKKGGVKNDQELINFVTKKMTKGLTSLDIESPAINCSSFFVQSESGAYHFARNYDMKKSNVAIVHTDPGKGGYRSVSSVDLSLLSFDPDRPLQLNDLKERAQMLATPYGPLDGMNEKGLAVAVYMSYQSPQDVATDLNDQDLDLTTTTMLRYMLDSCATVEEAIELAQKINLHDSADHSYHYMVADATGDSAILEWIGENYAEDTDGTDRQLHVIRKNDKDSLAGTDQFQIATNFIVAPDYYETDDKKHGLDRYELLKKELNAHQGQVKDVSDSLSLLQAVGRRNWPHNDDANSITTHSVVYDVSNKKVHWVGNEHFSDKDYYYEYDFSKAE